MIRRLLFALLLLVPGAAAAEWREASSKHFLIYSEAGERELRDMAERLERFDSLLRAQRGLPDPERSPATRVTIFVVRDLYRLRDYVAPGSRAGRIGGIYFPRASGSIILTPRIAPRSRNANSIFLRDRVRGSPESSFTPQVVLLHEYMHHFMYNNFNFGAPLWFTEGYPEFYATARFEDDGAISIGIPPWYRNYELNELPPIDPEELLLRPVRNFENPSLYGQGWLLTHYLVFEPSRQGQLDAYVRALSAGRSMEEAAAVFGDLDRLRGELRAYLSQPSWGYSTVPANLLSTGPIAIRDLSDAEQAVMEVRIRSKRGVNEEQAQGVARDAREAAAPYPNHPVAQLALAEAEYDAGQYDAAEAAADRALAADPDLVDAHLYKARAMWGRAEAAGNRDPALWEAIRGRIATANRLDPHDPEPLILFYDSYAPAGVARPEVAVEGLLYAQELAREDRSLRFVAARELLEHGFPVRALALLTPLASNPHLREKVREKLIASIDALRANDAPAALARLDELRQEQQRAEAGTEEDEED